MRVLLKNDDGIEVHSFVVERSMIENCGIVRHEDVVYNFAGIYDQGTLMIYLEAQVFDTSTLT